MTSLKKMLMSDETLFRNEDVFDPEYIPEVFSHRDSQLKFLAYCIKPALRGKRPLNSLIVGNPATGKTTSIKKIFSELESSKIITVHINCQISSSKYDIFSKIYEKVTKKTAPSTGTSFTTLYEKILEKIKDKVLLVVLDDANDLVKTGKINDILYSILRSHEINMNVKTSVWCVVQEETINLDDKVRSIFIPETIKFPKYSYNEIYDILKKRADTGLYEGVISKDVLEIISEKTSNRNDLRFGIDLIRKTALKAESFSEKKITKKHLDEYLETTNEDIVLSLAEKESDSKKIFDEFTKATELSYPTFLRIIKKMESEGKIKTESGNKSKSEARKISLLK